MLRPVIASASFCIITMVATSISAGEPSFEWPSWRGPRDQGSIVRGSFPIDWTPQDARWKIDLPGKGCSTPIVHGEHIYVTAPSGGVDALLAIHQSGKLAWTTTFGKEIPGRHRNGSGCNASPVTDGRAVFVYFKSGTLAAVRLDGQILWQKNLIDQYGPVKLYWDHGTSPVLTRNHVVMARIHGGDSWLAAFDKRSGKLAWKVARNFKTPREGDHGYTTPIVIQRDGQEYILVWGAQHVTMHDATDGHVIWTCGGFNPEDNMLWPAVASPVVSGDMVIVPFGRNDRGQPRLHGIRIDGKGDVTRTHRVWKRDDIGTFVPTPAAYRRRVYILGDKGQLTCLDPATGKTLWTDRFPKHRAKYYGSPLVAAGKLYAVREDGTVFVASIDAGFKLLADNPMGEPIIASPVPLADGLLLRGWKHLYRIDTK